MSSSKKPLTASMIALINIAAVCNIKNFPLLAEYGLSVILFLALAALFFFLPVAFVSAELSAGWPEKGVYTWVREAMGPRMGFLAIWLQWIENVIYYPTLLSFIAATIAYLFDPTLASNKTYIVCVILPVFWLATAINFFGMKVSGWFSSLTAIFGTIIPIVLIIGLGAFWLLAGHTSQITFSWHAALPDLTSLSQLVLLSGVLFGLAGMEMSSVHALDVKNPMRDYPRGIFLSAILILLFSAFGAISISSVVPSHEIQLASGGMEAFRYLFDRFNFPLGVPLIAAVTAFGALGMLSTWIVGPSRGIYATAMHGDLPPLLHKSNSRKMPVAILLVQALIASLLCLVFLFMPSVNSSYWILLALAAILYQLMYILLFLSAIILRYKYPKVKRPFRIPFGNVGMWIIGLLGMIGSLFGLIFAFFPPSQFPTGKLLYFEAFLIGGTLIFCLLPIWIYNSRKPSWHLKTDEDTDHSK